MARPDDSESGRKGDGTVTMELLGERILLREFRRDDIAALSQYHADARYLEYYGPEVGSRERTERLLDSFLAWTDEQPRRNFQLAIEERASGGLIGCCGLRTQGMPAGVPEFGVELAPDRWGIGLALEASRLMIDFGFRTLTSEVRAKAVGENARVDSLLRRLGFSKLGTRGGEAWMKERGWTLADWMLARDRWIEVQPPKRETPRPGFVRR